MVLKHTLALLTLLLFAASPCFAQSEESDTGDDEAAPGQQRKQYLVEVIIFEYLGPDSSAGETFDSLVVSDYFPSSSFDIEEYNRVNKLVSYTNMNHLAGALQRLSNAEQYRVMKRLAWTQPLLNREEAIDIDVGSESGSDLRSLDETASQLASDQLAGSVRVFGDHLLFVELNIRARLDRRRRNTNREDEPDGQTSDNGFTSVLSSGSRESRQTGPRFNTYHIAERRRIKLEEYHYFDHPYLGAIVSVWRH